MASKKEEHDVLDRLSEKDLWVQDLDALVAEWEHQLKEAADDEKTIRNTNRRVSRKIGAGKGGKSKPKKDEEYNPKPSKAAAAKSVVKVENKPHKKFLEMFTNDKSKVKPKPSLGLDGAEDDAMSGLSDGDFDALVASKSSREESASASSRAVSAAPVNGRAKRAAAAAPKKWVIDDDEESESDDDKLLGDIGDMVKGIGGGNADETLPTTGRVSLYQARPTSSHGPSASSELPKTKSKASRTFNLSDDDDQTNYEMLARSSPHKSAPLKDELDSFLSDDDAPLPVKKAAAKPAPVKQVRKPKTAPVRKAAPAPKPTALSPAAKAYAAKQGKANLTKKMTYSEDEDDLDMDDAPLKPAARTKAAPKKSAISDDEDEDMDSPPPKPASRAKVSAISDDEDEEMDSPPPKKPAPKPAARAKPAPKKKVISEDEEMDSPPPKPAARSKPAKKSAISDDESDMEILVPKSRKPAAKKSAISEDEDDLDLDDDVSPPPKPAGRGRPARSAAVAAAKKKPIYVDSEDEDEEMADDVDESALIDDEESEEDYESE